MMKEKNRHIASRLDVAAVMLPLTLDALAKVLNRARPLCPPLLSFSETCKVYHK
ncbi:MAG TPA: hypothetical protein VK603_06790 [Candidatus Saccharimonadales bacterium]|nr:hypothetical protein [Candidatus Saccharimonadales bacterium]